MRLLSTALACLISVSGFGQIYYYPEDDIDVNLTITVKEPFKPINYAELSQNFNDQLQAEVQRREALKRHYDDIAHQTISSIQSSLHLTSDNQINSLILKLQSKAIENINAMNSLLKRGFYGRNDYKYEQDVRKGYTSFINANQSLLYVLQFKFNTLSSLLNQKDINDFNNSFIESIELIEKISFPSSSNSVLFHLKDCLYLGHETINSSQLLDYVSSSSNGKLFEYKDDFRKKIEAELAEETRLFDLSEKIKIKRSNFLQTLNIKERKQFLKSEKNFLYNSKSFSWAKGKKKWVMKRIEEWQINDFNIKKEMIPRIEKFEKKYSAVDSHLMHYKLN